MNKKICLFLAAVLALVCQTVVAQISRTLIYSKGENGFNTYRIPAIVQTNKGTLLAFAEARKNSRSDTGDIDLVVKRSEDGGKTWGKIITVWDDGGNVCGNPSPVVDKETGRIVLVSTWNNGSDSEKEIHARQSIDTRRVFVLYSEDDGLTWSKAKDITESAKNPEWTWYATGPCHAIQLESGRIVVPCNHGNFKDGKGVGTTSHVIYSDDKGDTWHIGGDAKTGNESTIVELDNGDLMLNMRTGRTNREEYNYARLCAVSHDHGLTFESAYHVRPLIEPVCNASIIDYSPAGKKTGKILFSNPEHISKRKNMTVRMSRDNGQTWERICTLTEGATAYSDMCVLPNGDVAVLYESGETSSYENIMYARVAAKMFSQEADKVVYLYPEGQESDKGIEENGVVVTLGPNESNGFTQEEESNEFGNYNFVGDSARMEIYLPYKSNGQMVVVCPGGGYSTVCARKEGQDVAKWMARRGIATCVLIYRLPNGHASVPLTDVQNAFRYCRQHADEWGVKQIGVMGFSAGGHLAAMASNLYSDEITRPDFSVLIYPVIDLDHHKGTCENLVGNNRKRKEFYSMQNRVTSDTPRTFLALSQNDKVVDINSSLIYYDALEKAGVRTEMYLYPIGGHGYGFLNEEVGGRQDKLGYYRSLFSECLDKFLNDVKRTIK